MTEYTYKPGDKVRLTTGGMLTCAKGTYAILLEPGDNGYWKLRIPNDGPVTWWRESDFEPLDSSSTITEGMGESVPKAHVDGLRRQLIEYGNAKYDLIEALRLTQEYAQLPAEPGWAWYDALKKYAPETLSPVGGTEESEEAAVNLEADLRRERALREALAKRLMATRGFVVDLNKIHDCNQLAQVVDFIDEESWKTDGTAVEPTQEAEPESDEEAFRAVSLQVYELWEALTDCVDEEVVPARAVIEELGRRFELEWPLPSEPSPSQEKTLREKLEEAAMAAFATSPRLIYLLGVPERDCVAWIAEHEELAFREHFDAKQQRLNDVLQNWGQIQAPSVRLAIIQQWRSILIGED